MIISRNFIALQQLKKPCLGDAGISNQSVSMLLVSLSSHDDNNYAFSRSFRIFQHKGITKPHSDSILTMVAYDPATHFI